VGFGDWTPFMPMRLHEWGTRQNAKGEGSGWGGGYEAGVFSLAAVRPRIFWM